MINFYEAINNARAKGQKVNIITYSRVSTTHKEQLQSLEEQKRDVERLLKKYPNELNLVDNLVEPPSTGTNDIRDGYQSLLKFVSTNKVDFVICKDQSRLNRCVANDSKFYQTLAQYNTYVFYLMGEKAIDPRDAQDMLFCQFQGMMDENYSRIQSSKGKYAHTTKCINRTLSRQNECFGYKFNVDTKQMEIFEDEAQYIREIFELYVFKDMGCTEISDYLFRKGVYGFKGNSHLSVQVILKYLRNTAYIGDMTFNHRNNDFIPGIKTKRIATNKSEYVHVSVPPIIKEELFNLAQRKLDYNSKSLDERNPMGRSGTNFKGTTLFATKVICGDCHNNFLHKVSNGKTPYEFYYCSQKKRVQRKNKAKEVNGEEPIEVIECQNHNHKILQDTLVSITLDSINQSKKETSTCIETIIEALNYTFKQSNNVDSSTKKIKTKISTLEKKHAKGVKTLLQVEGRTFDILKQELTSIEMQIDDLNSQLDALNGKSSIVIDSKSRLEQIRKYLSQMVELDSLSREDVLKFLDYMIINDNDTIDVFLNFGNHYNYPIKPINPHSRKVGTNLYLYKGNNLIPAAPCS